ncbi:ABC transporter ATP-binding protein [Sphingosinicella sp. CPCC 101087]|uniref:ATP-binding cassette domain-containing protein n=1 Tax=Sphingosinicella sp. CPCC 101087 TaxID=2497754 RepID=UPI00101C5B30|nr:ABC transporter ATP-binding protein [Sphingosinicella sp. CPCC 101087]
MTDSGPRVALEGVTRRRGGQLVLDGIDLSIAAGEFVALIGPSGSGKTTLLKAINRLVEPDSGRILFDGREVRDLGLAELRRGIGYVFQGIGLFPHMTVGENIWLVPRLAGAPGQEQEGRVAELLDLVALPSGFAHRLPRSLSGGQAQRVGVARALAARPRLMLMDEPFGALDPVTRDELGAAYRALHDRLGLTSLMVTHDLAEALLLADRIIVLIEGRIRADAPPARLADVADPEVRRLVDVLRRQAERVAALTGPQ